MSNGWHVTENDINLWADRESRKAQENLPLLIGKLILASINPSFFRIPSGSAILTRGWDGDVEVSQGSFLVPTGLSFWESSTRSDIKKKADEDYTKRTKNPGVNPKAVTYICVSSRIWPDARQWQQQRNAEGIWKEVKAIDAVVLKNWLHLCPSVHRWFARIIGKRPEDAIDLEQGWNALKYATKPPNTEDLVIAGRDKSAKALIASIKGNPCIVRIYGDSISEAYAFSLACIVQFAQEYTPRVLVINKTDKWMSIIDNEYPLILIPRFDSQQINIGLAVEHGHTVIVPESGPQHRSLRSQGNQILLSKPKKDKVIGALIDMGIEKDKAEKIVTETRGFLMPVLRHEGLNPQDFKKPAWATKEHAPSLIIALLLGAWDDRNNADKGKIEKLSGMPYDEFIQNLHAWAVGDDPPVRKIGNIWQVTSRQDLWQMLTPFISEPILEKFEAIAEEILKELDPRYTLKLDERWLANLHKKIYQHSLVLRKGVAETLLMLSVFGDEDLHNVGEITVQDRASILVRKILVNDMSAHRWYSLRDLLPYIAEASPDVFLEATECGLKGEQPIIMDLFKEEGDFGGCPHAGLLWALECISWNINVTARVIQILAKLSRLDPGGNWGNRPFESIRHILSSALPQSKIGVQERLELIDLILSQEPEIGWKLLLSLIPKGHAGIITPIYKPSLREWHEGWISEVRSTEYIEYTTEIYYRVIAHAMEYPDDCLLAMIDTVFSQKIPIKIFNFAFKSLQELSLDNVLLNIQHDIYEKLINTICVHRKFADTKWVMDEKMVEKLEEILRKFTPEDPVDRYRYLFNGWHIDVICGPDIEFEVNEAELKKMRLLALEEIWQKHKHTGIISLIEQAQVAYEIGTHLANTSFTKEIEKYLLTSLTSENKNLDEAAKAFVYTRSTKDKGYLHGILSNYKEKWDASMWVNFCLALPFNKDTFNLIGEFSEEVKKLYWKNVRNYYRLEGDHKDVEWVIRQLIDNDRPIAALDVASHYLYTIAKQTGLDVDLLAEILEKVATDPKDADCMRIDLYKVGQIFRHLQQGMEINKDYLIQLEWLYIEVFEHNKYAINAQAITLVDEVLENPSIFAKLIKWAYRADPPIDEEFPDLSNEERKILAKRASSLLELINNVPGRSREGDIDSSELKKWVEDARAECDAANRLSICDIRIGYILAYAPKGDDDIWPHQAVRILLEEIESIDMEHGIETGVYNLRGTVTRPCDEGGVQERKLAEGYGQYADKIRSKSPRTAALLKRIENRYIREARQEDLRVEKRDLI